MYINEKLLFEKQKVLKELLPYSYHTSPKINLFIIYVLGNKRRSEQLF